LPKIRLNIGSTLESYDVAFFSQHVEYLQIFLPQPLISDSITRQFRI